MSGTGVRLCVGAVRVEVARGFDLDFRSVRRDRPDRARSSCYRAACDTGAPKLGATTLDGDHKNH